MRTSTSGPNGGGRPPKDRGLLDRVKYHAKCDIELVEAICAYVADGVPVIDAAALCGMPWATVYNWRASHPQIDLMLSEAEAKATNKAVRRLMHEINNPEGDWKASLEYLKRRRKDDWSDRRELFNEHDGKVEIIVKYDDDTQG